MAAGEGRICAINLLPLKAGAEIGDFERFSAEIDQSTCLAQDMVEGFDAYAVTRRDPGAPAFDIVEVMTVRSAVKIPLDVWAITFDSFGGMNRLWEAGEIAAVAAPVYFKVEPGGSEGAMSVSWKEPTAQDAAIRNKVRHAKILLELAARTSPGVEASPARAAVGHGLAAAS